MDPNTENAEIEAEVTEPEGEEPESNEAEAKEDAATSDSEKQDEDKERERKGRRNRRTYDQRISQLTAQLREAREELEKAQAKSSQPDDKPPKREDFDDYEEYVEAKAEYRAVKAAEQRLAEAEAKRAEADKRSQYERQQQAFTEARETTFERGADLYDDFEEVASNEDLTISETMAAAILSSKKGAELWYYLGKNPELAEDIASMNDMQQVYELGRLEASLGTKKASNAPKPTKTVTARGTTSNALGDNLPIDEWMKRRREQVRKSV